MVGLGGPSVDPQFWRYLPDFDPLERQHLHAWVPWPGRQPFIADRADENVQDDRQSAVCQAARCVPPPQLIMYPQIALHISVHTVFGGLWGWRHQSTRPA